MSGIKRLVKQYLIKPIFGKLGFFYYCGQKVFFPKNSIIFNRAMNEGFYEEDHVILMRKLVKPNTTIFDVGANIGLLSIPILAKLDSIQVIAVEASPNSLPYLKKTQQQSNFKDRWTIIEKAVLNQEGEISFHLATKDKAAFESILNTQRTSFVNTITVPCTTLDQIWLTVKQPSISFIKIDIEGADLLALQGATACINACKPIILMEWEKRNIIPFQLQQQDLLTFIKSIDYTLYALPYYNKCENIKDLILFSSLYESFLLVPNEENNYEN
jgi:FkbM family methyltransferase